MGELFNGRPFVMTLSSGKAWKADALISGENPFKMQMIIWLQITFNADKNI